MDLSHNSNILLAEQSRALFTERVIQVLSELSKTIRTHLTALTDEPGNSRQMQERSDGRIAFDAGASSWVRGTADAWTKAQKLSSISGISGISGISSLAPITSQSVSTVNKFELMGKDVMEDKILSSRLALRLIDVSSWEFNDLRLRVQSLEGASELNSKDIFRPETLAHHMVEQWLLAPISREVWLTVQELIQRSFGETLQQSYHAVNEFLIQRGVMVEIDLRQLVRLTPSAVTTQTPRRALSIAGSQNSAFEDRLALEMEASNAEKIQSFKSVFEETRMETGITPLTRVRMHAQGVMGQLKRLLSNQVQGFDETTALNASGPLAQELLKAQHLEEEEVQRIRFADEQGNDYGQVDIDRASHVLRDRSQTLKTAATTSSEKATIEIVALMFQSILAEERIPAVVRVWFARLQMPVLRLAISEQEFFGSLQHPARLLIDRMGSCVLGFDVTVSDGTLELEIKRIAQVIEQYPETGRRVFQLVYDEFDKFLSKFLSERLSVARVVSVAQQLEQKETMAVQYTIELRKMLNDMPVREEIGNFLFKTWSDVLAIAAVKNGPQHEQTLILKKVAADLVWAASAKPNRVDRAQVISNLPKLLQRLRLGMSMVGLDIADQEAQLKVISDTLADAFMSKTAVIPIERIDLMAKRVTNLEDYLSDEDLGDLPLDIDGLVTMIGLDAAEIEVILDGGSQPSDAMRTWAQELQIGAWFRLDHNGKLSHVQFSWCSDRKQLHLFAAADGRNFLIQARRLAAYLQAGLLVPMEEEALTVRATREALAKLEANPERLLD